MRIPSEAKRYRKKGWVTAMRSEGGRINVMRKILEGKDVLAG